MLKEQRWLLYSGAGEVGIAIAEVQLEAISKKSFVPISALPLRFNSSKYLSMHPKGISFVHLRVETQGRLDLEPKSVF